MAPRDSSDPGPRIARDADDHLRFPHESGKVAVMGLLERHTGRFDYRMIDNKLTTPDATVRQAVTTGSNLYTDALGSYRKLNDEYIHKVIDHAEECVEGEVHTNGLENFWSLLKRAIHGIYVSSAIWTSKPSASTTVRRATACDSLRSPARSLGSDLHLQS